MIIHFQNQSSIVVPKKFLETVLASCGRRLLKKKAAQIELQLVFLNPVPARKLNAQFRGRDYATDVLSFAPVEPGSLGELVLCPQVLKKQAVAHGWSFKHECGLMVIHGFLHLLGYDHEKSRKEEIRMMKLQQQLVDKLLL